MKTFFELAEDKPVLFSYLLLGEHTELKKYPQEDLQPKDVLIRLVEAGQEGGTCREIDSRLAGAMLLGMILRVTVFRREGALSARLTDLIDDVAAACWRVVGKDTGEIPGGKSRKNWE